MGTRRKGRDTGSELQHYRIKVRGNLDVSWSEWFDGLDVDSEDGITTLTGSVPDQPTLRGILARLWDLNLSLISVEQIQADEAL